MPIADCRLRCTAFVWSSNQPEPVCHLCGCLNPGRSLFRFSQFAIRQTAYYFENANRFEADLLMQLGRGVKRGTAEDAETTEPTMQKLSPKTKPKPRKTSAERGKGKRERKRLRERERRAGNNGILVLNCSDLYTYISRKKTKTRKSSAISTATCRVSSLLYFFCFCSNEGAKREAD